MNKKNQDRPKFLFRCDVSPETGIGHLRRCSSLAVELRDRGAFIFFICRASGINMARELNGVADALMVLDWSSSPETDVQEVVRIYKQQGIDMAVIDHYRADGGYQEKLYGSGIHWMQFDGSARYELWADWMLNASPFAEESIYLPMKRREQLQLMLGPAYALLRREFREWQPQIRFNKNVRRILITLGGGDDRGATVFCLEAIKSLDPSIERVVLASSINPFIASIVDWVEKNSSLNVTVLIDEQEIARNMAEADLAIIAGGTTTFETAAMGLPSMIIQLAENQQYNANAWQKLGVAIDAGTFGGLIASDFKRQVDRLIHHSELRKSMAQTGRRMVDCLGAERVARILLHEARKHNRYLADVKN